MYYNERKFLIFIFNTIRSQYRNYYFGEFSEREIIHEMKDSSFVVDASKSYKSELKLGIKKQNTVSPRHEGSGDLYSRNKFEVEGSKGRRNGHSKMPIVSTILRQWP